MMRFVQCALITVAAVSLFIGLRALPDTECGFLHYDPPVVDGDGIEYCGNDQPVFVEVRELKYPVKTKLSLASPPRVGEPAQVTLEFTSDSGRVIAPKDLAITHTELMHVLLVDSTRRDYHHVHPEPVGPGGQWQFTFTPERPGPYTVFAEFVPNRTKQVVLAEAVIEVAGEAPTGKQPPGLPAGWTARLDIEPAAIGVNDEARLRLRIAREDGQPAALEPVMGAWAHLVAFDEAVSGFAHLHPKYTGREKGPEPQLEFVFSTHRPGAYQIWAQVKVDGQERFVPFETLVSDGGSEGR